MGEVRTFTPRPRAVAASVGVLPIIAVAERAELNDLGYVAFDIVERIVSSLNRKDGDAEPSLAAPENHHRSQVV